MYKIFREEQGVDTKAFQQRNCSTRSNQQEAGTHNIVI